MAWVDWVVGIGVFFLVLAFSYTFFMQRILARPIGFYDIKEAVFNYFNKIFDFGVPAEWIAENFERIGIISYIYRIPILISENAGIERINELVNVSLVLDEDCKLIAWKSTLRLIKEDKEIPYNLSNITFCEEDFLRATNISFLVNSSANSSAFYFLYFSKGKNVVAANYTLGIPEAINATPLQLTIYPIEKIKAISVAKLIELKKIPYEEAVKSLGNYDFSIKISK